MVRDGIFYSFALLFLGLFAAWLGGPAWGAPAWLLAAFVLYFFRDPERLVPAGDVVVSPADGKIVDVRRTTECGFAIGRTLIRGLDRLPRRAGDRVSERETWSRARTAACGPSCPT